MQAQLIKLEADLQRISQYDRASSIPEKALYDFDQLALDQSLDDGDDFQKQEMVEV